MLRCVWSRREAACYQNLEPLREELPSLSTKLRKMALWSIQESPGHYHLRVEGALTAFCFLQGLIAHGLEIDRVGGSGSSFDPGFMVTITVMIMLRVVQLLQLQQSCAAVTVVLWLFPSTEKAALFSLEGLLVHDPNPFSG